LSASGTVNVDQAGNFTGDGTGAVGSFQANAVNDQDGDAVEANDSGSGAVTVSGSQSSTLELSWSYGSSGFVDFKGTFTNGSTTVTGTATIRDGNEISGGVPVPMVLNLNPTSPFTTGAAVVDFNSLQAAQKTLPASSSVQLIGTQFIGAPITGNGTLMPDAGNLVPRADDSPSQLVANIDTVFANGLNFFGTIYHSLYININGSISFGNSLSAYNPSTITQGSTPMIAPFWADVDTRGSSPQISYGLDTTNLILTVTWPGVDHYNVLADQHVAQADFFQLQLYDRGGGGNGVGDDFDIVFRYQSLQWDKGDVSSDPAHAGWTAGDQMHFFELPQSGTDSVLGLAGAAGNSPGGPNNVPAGTAGLWEWEVRNGTIPVPLFSTGSDVVDFNGRDDVTPGEGLTAPQRAGLIATPLGNVVDALGGSDVVHLPSLANYNELIGTDKDTKQPAPPTLGWTNATVFRTDSLAGDTPTITGTTGNYNIVAGAGNDTININGSGTNTITGGTGTEKITLSGGGTDTISGGKGNVDFASTSSLTGTLTINQNAAFQSIGGYVAGTLNVTDQGSSLETAASGNAGGYLVIGDGSANATLNVTSKATVTVDQGFYIGYLAGGNPQADVNDATLQVTNGASVGTSGSGSLTIENGGSLQTDYLTIAAKAGSTGTVDIKDAGTFVNATSQQLVSILVGWDGLASMTIESQASVQTDTMYVAYDFGMGTQNLDVNGATLTVTRQLEVGYGGSAIAKFENNANVHAGSVFVGDQLGSDGRLTVDGSHLTVDHQIAIGDAGINPTSMTVKNGGQSTSQTTTISGLGALTVDGAGSVFHTGNMTVGDETATLAASNALGKSNVWNYSGAAGDLVVDNGGYLAVDHMLTITDDASVLVPLGGSVEIGGNTGIAQNELQVDAGGMLVVSRGILSAFVDNGTVEVQSGNLFVGDDITGNGTLQIDAASSIELAGRFSGTVSFMDASGPGVGGPGALTTQLQLDHPGQFTGTLANMNIGDSVLLNGNVLASEIAHTQINGQTLQISYSNGNVLNYALAGNYAGDCFTVQDLRNNQVALTLEHASPQIHTGVPGSGYGNPFVDALINGWGAWNPNAGPITYWFGTPADVNAAVGAHGPTNFLTWNQPVDNWAAAEKADFVQAVGDYAAVCGLSFAPAASAATANIVWWLEPSLAALGALGISDFPALVTDGQLWEAFNNTPWNNDPNQLSFGGDGLDTIIHEIGHTLGLAHPHDGGLEPDATTFPGAKAFQVGTDGQNQAIYTIMSYNQGWNGTTPYLPPADFGTQGALGAFDIAAMQALYGAKASNLGDDTYLLPQANAAGTGWSSIWDSGGNDTISNAGSNLGCTIDLRDAPLTGPNAGGYASHVDNVQGGFTIAHGVNIQNAIGGNGGDVLIGGSGNDTFQDGSGTNQIYGGSGFNTVILSGASTQYNLNDLGDDVWQLVDNRAGHPNGTDFFTNIQDLQFTDKTIALAPSGNGPTITIYPMSHDTDLLTAADALNPLLIEGTSTGALGRSVTVTFNNVHYTGTVGTGGVNHWSVTVPASALAHAGLPNGLYTVRADVTDANGVAAPQAKHSLAVSEIFPAVASVQAAPSGPVVVGQTVQLTLNMNEPVTINGVFPNGPVPLVGNTPILTLNDGELATYDANASTLTTLVFDSPVAAGDHASNLMITAINLNGSTVLDLVGNPANFSAALNVGTGVVVSANALAIAALDADKPGGSSGTTPFTFTVTRGGDTTGTTKVNWTVTAGPGPAADVVDFGGSLPTGTLTFTPGQTSQTLTISVKGDSNPEGTENFLVTLSNPVGVAGIDPAHASAQGHIRGLGVVEDGYISGATVFADANGNGKLDTGEASTKSDASGHFTLTGGSGTLVAFGGSDILTGLAFTGTLMAPAGSVVLSPLTTLVVDLQAQGLTSAQAQQNVLAAFNLSPSISLTSLDTIAGTDARDGASAAAFVAAAKTIDTVDMIAATLTGTGVNASKAYQDTFAAIASTIKALAPGQTYDLSNQTTVTALINRVAQTDGINVSTFASNLASVIVASNAALDAKLQSDHAGFSLLADGNAIERVAQGATSTSLQADAGHSAQIISTEASFTGNNLTNAITAAENAVFPLVGQTLSAPTVAITNSSGATNQLVRMISGTVDVADAGSTVTVFDGTTPVATSQVAANGTWSVSIQLSSIAGTHSVTAQDTNQAGNIGISHAVPIALQADTVAQALADYASNHAISSLWVDDSSSNVVANLKGLEAMVGAIATITLSDSIVPTLTLSGGQYLSNYQVIDDISSHFHLQINWKAIPVLQGLSTDEQQSEAVYVAFFSRAGDVPGLNFWVGNLDTGQSIFDVALNFSKSAEAQNIYSFLQSPSIDSDPARVTFIQKIYQDLFNRASDTAGLNYWDNELHRFQTDLAHGVGSPAGATPPLDAADYFSQRVGNFIMNIIGGAQNSAAGQDITTFQNKVAVATYFTEQLASHNLSYANNQPVAIDSQAHVLVANTDSSAGSVATQKAAVDSAIASDLASHSGTATMIVGLTTVHDFQGV
jgi:serralysin